MINGYNHWLWRAVDQDGFVLEVLVQKHRDTREASGSSANYSQPTALHPVSWSQTS